MPARVTIDTAAVNNLFYATDGPVQQGLRDTANTVAAVSRRTAPKGKTKNLAKKIIVRPTKNGWAVIAFAEYAFYVHEGTQLHPISAHRPPRFMKFYWDKVGKVVYFEKVNHPGHPQPQPFLLEALGSVVR